MRRPTLITGGAGFVGSNLADALLQDGERVIIADNFSRAGVSLNAEWLGERHGKRCRIEVADVRDRDHVKALVAEAGQVFHLAAQVAVTTSVDDPVHDLETNLLGTFHILEAARALPTPPPLLFTSTNKVYGGLEEAPVYLDGDMYRFVERHAGIGEDAALDFHSPYGCSKGAADQYVRDYARIYGLRTVVFRMSCVYGTRQFGTEDQGWVAHFARSLLAGEPVTIYGDGCQVRGGLDVINAHERDPQVYLDGMRAAVEAVASGRLDPSPLYTHTFRLDQLGDALNATRDRPDGFLKALVLA